MTFPSELKCLKGEHFNYWYSVKSFYLAKTAADLPLQVRRMFKFFFYKIGPRQTQRIGPTSLISILDIGIFPCVLLYPFLALLLKVSVFDKSQVY